MAAARVQIMCINKTNRQSAHEKISHVGGVRTDGQRWKMTQQDAINSTKAGTYEFFTSVAGRTARVIVARSAQGHEYLKTENDGEMPNNLLSLPECP